MQAWYQALQRLHRRRLHARQLRRQQHDYQRWLLAFDTLDATTLAALAGRLQRLPARPVIGLVLQLAGDQPDAALHTLAALRAQLYRHWALCLVHDATVPLPAALADALRQDARLSAVTSQGQAAPAVWRNAATALGTPWIALLAGADRLAPHALLLLAEAAQRFDQAQLLYADHDRLDAQGRRCAPQFKSDWNPTLLWSSNYLQPLLLVRHDRFDGALRALALTLPAVAQTWTKATDAALLHALALQVGDGLDASQAIHVPHVLVHAAAPGAAQAVAPADMVPAFLQQRGVPASLRGTGSNRQLRIATPEPPPLVSVIVPTRDRLELLRPCVQGLLERTGYRNIELLIVDNGSQQPATLDYLAALAADPRVRVLHDARPFNYAALNNLAAAQARGSYLLLLNNDTEVMAADWLDDMVGLAALPGTGAVGARLWYGDGTLQHAGLFLGLGGVAGDAHRRLLPGMPGHQGRALLLQEFSAVTAACLLVSKAAFDAVGGLDAERFAVAYNDVDFCLRLRGAGYRNLWAPQAQLLHHESRSRGSDHNPAQRQRFEAEFRAMQVRWGPALQHDPFYNPNLSLDAGAFTLAWPPRVSLRRPWFDHDADSGI